jgi:hypothetical protein
MATNDEAREAASKAFRTWMAALPQQLRTTADGPMHAGYLQGYRDALRDLRATGQLCTAEERSILDGCLEYKRSLDRDLWSRSVDVCQKFVHRCVVYAEAELARRAKGGAP